MENKKKNHNQEWEKEKISTNYCTIIIIYSENVEDKLETSQHFFKGI